MNYMHTLVTEVYNIAILFIGFWTVTFLQYVNVTDKQPNLVDTGMIHGCIEGIVTEVTNIFVVMCMHFYNPMNLFMNGQVG